MTEDPENPALERLSRDVSSSAVRDALETWRAAAPYLGVLRQNRQHIADSAALIRRHMAALSVARTAQLSGVMPPARLWEELSTRLLPQLRGVSLQTNWFTSRLPRNWQDGPSIGLDAAVTVLNEGIPLVWVPRREVVAELADAADSAERDTILVRRRSEVAEDCASVLEQVDRAPLAPLVPLALEVTRAIEAGFASAGQALAANIFDTWLRGATERGLVFQPQRPRASIYRSARGQIEPVSDETLLIQLHQICVLTPVVAALEEYWSGQPIPGRFSRHATAHHAGPDQYTEANAIVAMMLVASLLRESQESGW